MDVTFFEFVRTTERKRIEAGYSHKIGQPNYCIFVLKQKLKMEILTIEQIKALYPDQWVLVGNPQMREDNFVGSILQKLIAGLVLYNSKDKKEIAYKTPDLTKNVERFTCIYTGEIPKNKRFWL